MGDKRRETIGAVDVGYGWTKAAVGGKTWRATSVLGEINDLFEQSIREDDLIYNDQYFIGDLALRHSDITYGGTKKEKAKTWTTEILIKTALGMTAPRSDVQLVTGLPVDYYFKQREDYELLLTTLSDTDIFKLQQGFRTFDVRPRVTNYKLVPQPFGSAMNYLLNDKGEVINSDAKKRILVIDVGFYTLDLLELNSMEIGKNSCSPPELGINTAYKLLRRYLKKKAGKAPGRYELDRYVLKGEFEGYDLEPLVNKAFKSLGSQISLEVESLNTNYDRYIVTGGWAEKIAKYINVPDNLVVTFGQLGNVEGYKKIGARIWGAQ